MRAKLTLKLDKSVIEKAKSFAIDQGVSLSFLVENYLKVITEEDRKAGGYEISSFVKSITIGNGEVPVGFNYKMSRQEFVSEKQN